MSTDGVNPYARDDPRVINTPFKSQDEQQVSVNDFLQLMIAQLKNQDFTNPVDDTQYVTQLAQFATMQQMQDLAYYSKSNYVMSLVGKNVTVASLGLGGNMKVETGPVEKVALSNKEFMIFVDGKGYTLGQIMEVNDPDRIGDNELKDVPKMAVILEYAKQTSAKVRWDSPIADEALAKQMKYSVYYSKSEDFNTVGQVKKGTLVGTAETEGMLDAIITGLEPNTTYFVNVVIKTPGGKEEVYQKRTFTTEGP